MVDRRTFLTSAAAGAAAFVGGRHGHVGRRAVPSSSPRTLAQAIRGQVIERGSPAYPQAAHVYNERFDWVHPSAVARPVDAADVQAAIRWTTAHGVPIRARSGGHSYAGYSTLQNGAVLDLRRLSAISIDRAAGTATIGAGCQLLNVYAALAAHGLTLPAGSCPSVGIAGHALGGGMGLAARHFGLACDNLVGAKIVTVDGRLRTVSSHSNPDLLWALKGGGGGNFGVVTELTFRPHPMPASASYFFVSWPWSEASEAVAAWLGWAPHATRLVTSVLHLNSSAGATSVTVSGQYFGPASALHALLAPLASIPGASITTGTQAYLGLMLRWAGCLTTPIAACHTVGSSPAGALPRASFDAKSDYISAPLSGPARATLIAAVEARGAQPGSGAILFDSYGGAINAIHPAASAFVHRNQLACVQYLSYGGGSRWLSDSHRAMRPYVSGYAYQNYIDVTQTDWQHAYYGSNYARLQSIRRAVDPHHYFNFPQAIGR
jgi:FAD/FMN-containing dehydrogenase